MKMTKPPKNREFIGLVASSQGEYYWDIFFWATKEYGIRKGCYTDRGLYDMPPLYGWQELPRVDVVGLVPEYY